MDYLLPDLTYDDCTEMDPLPYGRFLCELFEEWTKDQNPEIRLRILESILKTLAGQSSLMTSMGPGLEDVDVLTVSSNGQVSPDDILRKAGSGKIMDLSSIETISLKNFLQLPVMQSIKHCKSNLPKKCLTCCWQNVCQGGSYVHRYSSKNGLNNPSIMCEGLKTIFSKCSAFLLQNGVSMERLQGVLGF